MNYLTTELFFSKYISMMYTLNKEYCLGCDENNIDSSKYHTCYMNGEYHLSYMNLYGKYNSQDKDKAIQLVLRPYNIFLKKVDLIEISDWISKREKANTHSTIKLFREILKKKEYK